MIYDPTSDLCLIELHVTDVTLNIYRVTWSISGILLWSHCDEGVRPGGVGFEDTTKYDFLTPPKPQVFQKCNS